MADSARTRTLRLVHPEQGPLPGPITIDTGLDEGSPEGIKDGALKIENADGSVTYDLAPKPSQENINGDFYRNLASEIDEGEDWIE